MKKSIAAIACSIAVLVGCDKNARTPIGPIDASVGSVTISPLTNEVAAGGSQPLTVTVKDNEGKPLSGQAVVWSSTNNGSFSVAVGTTDQAGVASTTFTVTTTAPTEHVVTATAGGQSASSMLKVVAGAPTNLAFVGQPSTVGAGTSLAPSLQVSVKDIHGNTVTTAMHMVTITLTTTTNAFLSGSTTALAVNGVATFNNLSIDKAGTGYTFSVSAPGLAGATSGTFAVLPGPARTLVITKQPTPTVVGMAISPSVEVAVLDQHGNRVTSAANPVSISIAANPAAGVLGGTKTMTPISGIATFSDLVIDKVGVGYSLAVNSLGLTGATTNTFDVLPRPAQALVFTGQPISSIAGTMASVVEVTILDDQGNVATSAANPITIEIASNPSAGTLSGTAVVMAVNGIARFNNLSIDRPGVGYTLSAKSAALTPATSAAFTVLPPGPASLAFVRQPATTGANAVITPAIQVAIKDLLGNTVTSATNSVTVSIGTNPASASLIGTVTAPAVNGIATFSNLRIDNAGAGYRLVASASGLTTAISTPFNVTAGPPAQLTFTVQPSNTTAGGTITPAIQVTIKDANGNTVPTANNIVTLQIGTNPASGTLVGTSSVSAINGVATFGTLSILRAGAGYTLLASAPGLAGSTSSSFDITAGPPAQLVITTQPSSTAQSGVQLTQQPIVELQDQHSNAIAQAGIAVTAAIATGGGTLGGTTTVTTNANGRANFLDLSISGTIGIRTLSFNATGFNGATSNTVDVTPGPLDHFAVQSAGGGGIPNQAAGTPFNVTVIAQDVAGNTVNTFTGTVGFSSVPAGGISAGSTSAGFSAGVLASHSITFGTGGTYTLTATRTGGAESGNSNSFFVQAPAVANDDTHPTIGLGTSTPGSTPFHIAFNAASNGLVDVLANDQPGFPLATRTFGNIKLNGGPALGGTVTTNAFGGAPVDLGNGGNLSLTAAGLVNLTPPAGFTGIIEFDYRLANGVGSDDATVSIAVGARPSAVNDTYTPPAGTIIGNVSFNTATSSNFTVTANDLGDAMVLQPVVSGVTGGTITLNTATGTFTYEPAAGFSGPAGFTYTAGNGFGTSTATVAFVVAANRIWFVNSAATNGSGTQASPFNCLVGSGCLSAVAANGDNIFLHSGSYIGGFTLPANARLIGAAAAVPLSIATGLTPTPDASLPGAGGVSPTITTTVVNTHGVILGTNNTLRGFSIANTTGSAIFGTSFGTLTIGEIAINTAGQALNLSIGTIAGSFTGITSTGGVNHISLTGVNSSTPVSIPGSLSNSSSASINVSGGTISLAVTANVTQSNNAPLLNVAGGHSGTLAFNTGAISASSGTGLQFDNADGTYQFNGTTTLSGGDAAIDILNGSAGSFTFGSGTAITNPTGTAFLISASQPTVLMNGSITQNNSARGVFLDSNTGGTAMFGGTLTLNTSAANAFEATSANPSPVGSVTVQGIATNTLSTTTGTALRVNNVNIGTAGITLRSVTSSNAANGIVLINTGVSGGLIVTGDGINTTVGGNGSGGTLSNATGADGATAGNAVYLSNTRDVVLRRMIINGVNQNHGIRGVGVTNFTLEHSTITGTNGTSAALDEGAVNFDNLTGNAAITSSVIEGGFEDNLNIVNTSGTLNRLTVSGSTFGFNNTTNGNNNILLEAQNAGTTLNFTIQSSLIKGARADWINASSTAGSTMDAVIGGNSTALGNTFDNLAGNAHPGSAPGGNRVVFGAVGVQTLDVRNNVLRGSRGEAIRVRSTATGASTGTVNAFVRNNTIGVQGTPNSGSSEGSGIFAFGDGGSDMNVAIIGNTVHQHNNHGILLTFGDEINDGSVFNATVTGNTVSNPGNVNTDFNAIHLNNGTVGATDNFTSCVDIGGAGTLKNSVVAGGSGTIPPNNADIRLRQRQGTTVRLAGYAGVSNDDAAVVSYLTARNTLATAAASNTVPTGGGWVSAATCVQPIIP